MRIKTSCFATVTNWFRYEMKCCLFIILYLCHNVLFCTISLYRCSISVFFIEGEVHEYDEPSYSVMMPGGEFPGDRGYEMR
jgi:hypothetical protein